MRAVLEAIDFTPRRLARAVLQAIELHPGTATAPTALPAEGLSVLRKRVAEARGSTERLEQLALALSPRQMRALVTGLEQWEELREAVAFLLLFRGKPSMIAPLWRSWQRFPLVGQVREVLVQLASRFGWDEAAGPGYAELIRGWVSAPEPGVAIQRWLDGLRRSYADLPQLTASPLAPGTPLLKLLRDAILTHGSTHQLNVEGPKRLLEWNKELSPPQRLLFGRNYLVRIPIAYWDVAVLEQLERVYGLPRRPHIPEFWNPLPEEIKEAFQRHFIERRLREAFGGDSDRYAYWLKWMKALAEVRTSRVGGVDWALLRFDRFGVIEFFEVGNAAYFYENDLLEQVIRRPAYHPRDLKDLYSPGFTWNDNRLIHRGAWESAADEMVALWTKKAR